MSEDIKELEVLQAENKRLSLKLSNMQIILDRNKLITGAQSNIRAVIAANKSKQEKYLQLLLSNAPDVIMLFDQYGRFAYCTNAFLKDADIPNFGLINGRTYREIFSRFAGEEFIKKLENAFKLTEKEKRVVKIDAVVDFCGCGKPRNYSIQLASMRNEDGEPSGSLALFHDLTQLLNAKAQAEHANSAKSDFLATVSHEIRTPLNAIIGIADIMKNTNLDDKQQEHMRHIQNSSHMLLTLINDILDFSKIEAGKFELVNEYFNLSQLLNRVESLFHVMFAQKNLEFVCRFGDDLPEVVLGDEKRITQILTNLLNNSFKYTNEGRVIFSAALCAKTQDICFDVEDTGIGIKKEDMPRLFKAFEQFDKVKNKKAVGTGLGLAITKSLVELMRGSVNVKSEYGVGSCFSLRVHLPFGTESDIKREQPIVYKFVAPDAKILLVDDIEINLMVAKAMLKGYGIVPDTALNGKEALDMVKNKNYDLVLMDHMMPEMDGVEATQKIRELGNKYETLPVVALTANAVSGAESMFLSKGFNGFLSKPMDAQALAASLLKWLPKKLIKESQN
ncbi:MAG: response regulator [Endomicrobium sp.]|jgi:CheY-like chemotaxis protein/nitrogen-specific signal transduction histidine kinase|nr:response regulator [Endomicrobium sp.]